MWRARESRGIRSHWTGMAIMLLPSEIVVVVNLRRRLQYGRLESQYFLWLENIAANVLH